MNKTPQQCLEIPLAELCSKHQGRTLSQLLEEKGCLSEAVFLVKCFHNVRIADERIQEYEEKVSRFQAALNELEEIAADIWRPVEPLKGWDSLGGPSATLLRGADDKDGEMVDRITEYFLSRTTPEELAALGIKNTSRRDSFRPEAAFREAMDKLRKVSSAIQTPAGGNVSPHPVTRRNPDAATALAVASVALQFFPRAKVGTVRRVVREHLVTREEDQGALRKDESLLRKSICEIHKCELKNTENPAMSDPKKRPDFEMAWRIYYWMPKDSFLKGFALATGIIP